MVYNNASSFLANYCACTMTHQQHSTYCSYLQVVLPFLVLKLFQ
uniref:Uncharacterized protein n=1 Tax=Anguilla anguilla TaxID=7936 RepID=A0A0E9WG42_ANGAN